MFSFFPMAPQVSAELLDYIKSHPDSKIGEVIHRETFMEGVKSSNEVIQN